MLSSSKVNVLKYAETDIIYYDARLISPACSTGPVPVNPESSAFTLNLYNDQRQNVILANPESYYFSIIRFSISATTLPLFVANVATNAQFPLIAPSNVKTMPYVITLEYNGFQFGVNVEFRPEDKTQAVPPVAGNPNLYSGPYFWIYTYQHFVDLINTAFYNAYTGLAALTALPSVYPPFMVFNRETKTFDICADALHYQNIGFDGSNIATPAINIYFNNFLYDKFTSLIADHLSDSTSITPGLNTMNYRLRFTNTGDNLIDNNVAPVQIMNPYNTSGALIPYAKTIIKMKTEWDMLDNFCENSELIFSTVSIPVATSFIAPYIPYAVSSNSIVNTHEKSVTDFALSANVASTGTTRNQIIYVPSVYRYLTMQGSVPVSKIDLFMYWRTNRGIVFPLVLNTAGTMSLKIQFIKKSLLDSEAGGA